MNSYRWGAFLAAASIVIYQCFVPPIVGLADNADFLIVASRLSLDVSNPDDPDRYYRFLNNHYYYSDEPAWVPSVLTSEILLVLPGYAVSRVLSKTGHYDIRWAGVTHAAIFLLAIYWILPLFGRLRPVRRRVAAAIAIFILTDVVYVSYFNTLYTDAASLVTLLALMAGIVRFTSGYDRSRGQVYAIFALAVLFATSKVQHFILGLPVLALMAWYQAPLRAALGGGWAKFGALVGMFAAGMALMAATTAPRYSGMALYNVVFFHLLPNAPDPAAALRELGLPEKYVVHKGTHSFSEGSAVLADEQFQKEWQQLASFRMLLGYYLRHPMVTLGMLQMGLEESRIYRTMYGNFLKDSGYFAFTRSTAFSTWSWAKQYFLGPPAKAWMPDRGYWPHLAFTFLPALFLLWSMHSRRYAALHCGRAAVYVALSMALITMAVSSLSDVRETFRHLFLYNLLLDMIFIGAAGVACYGWRGKESL